MADMYKIKDQINYYNLYINGQWIESESGLYTPVTNPSTGQVMAYVTDADAKDVSLALETSKEGQKVWAEIPPIKRATYIYRLIELLRENKEHFAHILTREQGKTYKEALGEVDDTIAYMKFAADYAVQIKGDMHYTADPDERLIIDKVPFGVTLGLCAWNYPLALVGRKLGPALVTGNSMIIKPHELTPVATVEFMKLVESAGIPEGVVNVITGSGITVGNQLVKSPVVKLITVTGSVRAGQAIYEAAAPNITALSLELGGKAPFIVLEDADIDAAVDAVVTARYANCGQVCICSDMIFIQESIQATFTEKLLAKIKDIKVGDPFDEMTDMGPKASLQDLEKIDHIVKKTVEQGGKILTGGAPLTGGIFDQGYFYPPTVLTDVTPEMAAAEDEIFGPVLPILTVTDFKEAAEICNRSPYGLAAYLFTSNHKVIMEASRQLEVGTVFINQGITGYTHGFHNGHKLSGLGGEDGVYGLESYMQKRTLYMK